MIDEDGQRYYQINDNKVNISGLTLTNAVNEIKNISSKRGEKKYEESKWASRAASVSVRRMIKMINI